MADETNQLRVRLVTPERTLFDHQATAVELPAKNGYMEVLYGHAPLVAELGAGDVTLHGGPDGPESISRYNVSWGFAEVLPDRVTILASDALKPEEIDVTKPATAKRPIPNPSASSPKPKPRSPLRLKNSKLLNRLLLQPERPCSQRAGPLFFQDCWYLSLLQNPACNLAQS